MTSPFANADPGRVASLHLHPAVSGAPMISVDSMELVIQKGIVGEPRYFGRVSRSTGAPSRRQVSLIEREQISVHAAALGLPGISPGAVRANIETIGIDLVPLVGQRLQFGDAVLAIYEARTPCSQMDALCRGLRSLMENGRQGVIAEIVRSGCLRVNDPIRVVGGGVHS